MISLVAVPRVRIETLSIAMRLLVPVALLVKETTTSPLKFSPSIWWV